MTEAAGAVLDASALLAYLRDEPGKLAVEATLAAGAIISVVNYAEVLSRLSDSGVDVANANRRLRDLGLLGGLLGIEPLLEEDAVEIARLRVVTRAQGLSLGDRACLATGLRLNRTVLTADRVWARLDLGVNIQVIRS